MQKSNKQTLYNKIVKKKKKLHTCNQTLCVAVFMCQFTIHNIAH